MILFFSITIVQRIIISLTCKTLFRFTFDKIEINGLVIDSFDVFYSGYWGSSKITYIAHFRKHVFHVLKAFCHQIWIFILYYVIWFLTIFYHWNVATIQSSSRLHSVSQIFIIFCACVCISGLVVSHIFDQISLWNPCFSWCLVFAIVKQPIVLFLIIKCVFSNMKTFSYSKARTSFLCAYFLFQPLFLLIHTYIFLKIVLFVIILKIWLLAKIGNSNFIVAADHLFGDASYTRKVAFLG